MAMSNTKTGNSKVSIETNDMLLVMAECSMFRSMADLNEEGCTVNRPEQVMNTSFLCAFDSLGSKALQVPSVVPYYTQSFRRRTMRSVFAVDELSRESAPLVQRTLTIAKYNMTG